MRRPRYGTRRHLHAVRDTRERTGAGAEPAKEGDARETLRNARRGGPTHRLEAPATLMTESGEAKLSSRGRRGARPTVPVSYDLRADESAGLELWHAPRQRNRGAHETERAAVTEPPRGRSAVPVKGPRLQASRRVDRHLRGTTAPCIRNCRR